MLEKSKLQAAQINTTATTTATTTDLTSWNPLGD